MPVQSFEGMTPKIHPSAFVAETAVIIGDVTIEANASVSYNAVVRGDTAPIVIRAGANVQDCSVVHVNPADPVDIGPGVTVGHACVIHVHIVSYHLPRSSKLAIQKQEAGVARRHERRGWLDAREGSWLGELRRANVRAADN